MSSFLKSLQMEHWYDVLEAVSPMPGELRDLLTKSHELEIQLQSVLERNDRVSEAFFEAAHNMTDEERGCHFVRIKQYYKEEEDLAKEKVAVMQSVEDLLERYKLVVDQEYNRLRAAFDEESAGRADRIERRVKQEMERQNATMERVHVAARNGRRRKRVHAPKITGESQPASTVNGGDAATTVSKKSGNSESDNQPQSSSQLATSQANSDAPTVLESLVVKTEQRSDVELPEVKPTPPLITTKNESRHGRLRKVSSRVTALLDAEAATISTTRDHHHGGSHSRSKASKKASTVNTEVVAQADANAEAGDIDDQSIYCYCNQPSYGSMVACDSLTCKYEWFHYECVGVTEAPKGDWYCPDCHNKYYWIYKTSMSLLLQMDNQSPAPSHLAEINENRDRLIKKIEDVGVKIKAAMKTKEADVDEFLRVSGRLHDHESDNPQLLRIRVLFNRKNRKTTQLINSLQLTKLCETGSMRRGITETVLTNVGQGLKDVGVNIKESLSEYTGSVINAPKDFTRRLLKSKSGSADNIALSSTADKHKPAIGSIKSGAKEEDNSVFYFPLHSEDVESSSKDDDQSELSSPIQGVSRGFEDPDDLDPFFEEVRALQNAVASLSREIDRLKAQIQQEYNFFHGALHEEKYRYQHLEDQMNDMVELHQAEISNLKEEVQMIEGRLQYQFRDQIQDIQDLIGQMQTKVEFLEKSTKELQQAVGLENLSDSTAGGQAIRALLLFLQILIMLLVTLWNIVVPFIKSRTRLITTTTFVIFIIYLNKNWDTISAWLWTTSRCYRINEIPSNMTLILTQKLSFINRFTVRLLKVVVFVVEDVCNICDELVKSEEPLFLTCGCKLDICGYCLTRSVNQTGCCPGCHANVSITREWDEVFLDDFIEEGEKVKTRSNSTKSRRKLADLRVLQDNLVSVCGLPLEIADPDTLRSDDYFGKYGKIMRILINKKGKMPIAYITFQRSKDAMQAVAEFGKKDFGGQTVKASLGTTKYCSFFLKNSICKNHDCYFMHSRVPDEAAFTKEDLEKGKHFQYQKKLVDNYIKQRAMQAMKLQANKLKNEPPSTFLIGKKNGTAWGKMEEREIRNPIFGDYENDENSTVAKNELEKNDCSPLARKWQASEMKKLREKNDDYAELVGNAWNNVCESRLKNLFGERQSNLDAECETEDRTKDFEKQPPVIHIPCQHPFVSIKMANGMFSVSDVTSPSEVAFSSEAEQVAKPVAADVSTEGKRFAFDGKFENKSDSHFSDSFSARNVSDYDKWNGGIYGRLRNLKFDEMTDLDRQATVPPRAAFSIPQNEPQSTFKNSVWKGNQKTWKDVLGFACQNDFPPLSVSAKGNSWKENATVGGTKFDENFFGGASRISDTNSASASQMDWRKNEGQTGSSIYNALFEQENNKCRETFSPNPILNTERGTMIRDNFGGNNVNMSLNYGDSFNEMATTFTQNAQFEEGADESLNGNYFWSRGGLGVAFTVKLNHKIAPKAVTMGHFDDDQCSLVAVDNVGKVFLHTIEALKNAECIDDSTLPRFRLNQNASAMMNINRMVKIVATGHLKASDTCDAIVIGTATHILVYDVKNNCDLFYKEVSGGLESILIGRFGDFEEELIVCGGSCALQGFNWQGKEIFWSVTGDNVRSLCLCDFDSDGKLELLVGSDDFDIRAVTNLLSLGSNRFAYALANGTLGVYASACRLWRIKSKANPTFLCLYDIDGDDEQELVTGWSSGKVDFRKCQNGELVAKDHMSSAIVGMEIFGLSAKEGAYLLCCSSSGEVRGYFASSGKSNLIPFDTVRDTIRNLSIERQNLLVELENYEEKEIAAQSQLSSDNMALRIPTDTQVTQKLEVVVKENTEQPYLQLSLCTNNRTVLRGAIIFAERIFPGESYALLVPKEESCEKLEIPLRLEKDTASDLHIKALVGYSRSSKLYVFDLNQALPKFSMYALCNDTAPCPKNGVEFNIGDRGDLLCQWLMKNFLIDQANLSRDKFTVRFMNLRISCLIFIKLNDNGKVEICCDDIEVCGSMMQSLASYVDLEFKVTAYFPDIAKKYADLAKKVSKVSAVQDRLSADMSEQISIAKSVLLHGEDSRVLEDWDKMKEHYKQLSSLNDTLLSLQNVRLGNSAHLSDLLKRINQIIQNASNLKVGKHRSALIRACRSAIAAGNTASVRKLLDLDG
ncbi:Bardet-Biedl syndrome 2 -like protein [Trichinella zimbabwensis]|uniref:Inhibitor of growth protein n=1 Tax=Trichinella zimbabwensis TaxID=268475 RepID=A0A0V1HQJ7_9BILA|nr:Bardet-Biedl syndrome 2 -like protein [Trichinella zimbabwensis]